MSVRELRLAGGTPAGDRPLDRPTRPSWRGRLHLGALCLAVPLLVLLATAVDGARAHAAVMLYGVGLCSMLGVSATYHRRTHSDRSRAAWRRADHATIFAAIAGTCSGLALVSLSTSAATAMVVITWSAAVAGATFKVVGFHRAHRISGPLYIAFGWSGLLLLPAVWQRGGVAPAALLIGGGLVYTGGAIGFGRQWPTLRPATFSYHEVWHACTVVAAGLHFATLAVLIT